MLVEEALHVEPLPEVERVAVAEEQAPNGYRAPVAGDLDAPLREGRIEKAQDVELVGDETRVGEEARGEATVSVAHVERDDCLAGETKMRWAWTLARRGAWLRRTPAPASRPSPDLAA